MGCDIVRPRRFQNCFDLRRHNSLFSDLASVDISLYFWDVDFHRIDVLLGSKSAIVTSESVIFNCHQDEVQLHSDT